MSTQNGLITFLLLLDRVNSVFVNLFLGNNREDLVKRVITLAIPPTISLVAIRTTATKQLQCNNNNKYIHINNKVSLRMETTTATIEKGIKICSKSYKIIYLLATCKNEPIRYLQRKTTIY